MTQQTPIQVTGKHVLTQEEKDGKLSELLSAIQRKEELDAEKKQVMSGYKNKLDEQESNIKVISNLLNMWLEHRSFSCYLTKDFEEGKRFYHEVGTGKLISTEPLTAADYQTQMDLEQKTIAENNLLFPVEPQGEVEREYPPTPDEVHPVKEEIEPVKEGGIDMSKPDIEQEESDFDFGDDDETSDEPF